MLIPLYASIAPFLVWPVEFIFPYPYIVEELVKGSMVLFILKSSSDTTKIRLAILVGLFFAFSESVLYMFNILLVGSLWTPIERLLLTIPLHVTTTLLILFSGMRRQKLLPLGLIAAMMLHYLFNLFVGRL